MEMEQPQDAPGQRRLFLHPSTHSSTRSSTSLYPFSLDHSRHPVSLVFLILFTPWTFFYSLYRTWKDNVSEGWRTASWSGICSSGDTWLWPSSVHFINRTAPNRILRFSWNLKKRAVKCVQAQCGKLKKSRDGALTDNCLQAKVQAIKTRRALLSSMS